MLREVEAELATAERAAGGPVALAHEIASGIAAQAGSNLFAKIQASTRNSRLTKFVVKGVAIGAFCYGLQAVIGAFKNWGSLSDAAKAQNVINLAELGVDFLNLTADSPIPQGLFQGS